MRKSDILSVTHNMIEVYHILCKPVCRQYELAQTAFDILMFLANNPQYTTAKDIIRYRGIQANLVSTHVDTLVTRGLLTREPIRGDRRSIKLTCTQQAAAIIEQGRRVQDEFFHVVCAGIEPEEMAFFHGVMEKLAYNIVRAKGDLRKGGTRE